MIERKLPKMKKLKIISTLLVIAMLLSGVGILASCNDTKDKAPDNNDGTTPPADEGNKPDDEGNKPDDGGTTPGGDDGGTTPPVDEFLDVTVKPGRGEASCIPEFTERQIKNQKLKGTSLMQEIADAAADLTKSSFTIPAGDYGFDMDKFLPGVGNIPYAFALDGINRPDDNPFTIYAEGVTFWIQPTGKPCANTSYAFVMRNCSNIKVVGLTIDEYTPNDIEGTVTQIDRHNNRIAIKLTNSSMAITDEVIKMALAGSQCRIVPYKADGQFIAPLYRIEVGGWGPGPMMVKNFESTGAADEYWITFQNDVLIKTITDSQWKAAYGKTGYIEEGDVISFLYGNVLTNLNNCKQITIEGMNNHCTKGMPGEGGGYGAHVWKDCYFGPRPGSSKVMTAGEYMLCGTRVGSTLDNVTIVGSSDDQINIHGYLSKINSINGNTLSISYVQDGVLYAGDKAEFYDENGDLKFTATVAETVTNGNFNSRTVKFNETIASNLKNCTIRWPSQECDGWTIKNCTFINNYQRILIQCGSGTFENNKVLHMGMNLNIGNIFHVPSIYEGGIMGTITVKNNIFYNSSNGPSLPLIPAEQAYNFDGKMLGEKLIVENNIFLNCGHILNARNYKSIEFKNNIIIEPTCLDLDAKDVMDFITKRENVNELIVENNAFYDTGIEDGDSTVPTNKNCKLERKLLNQIKKYVANSDASATHMIEIIKSKL